MLVGIIILTVAAVIATGNVNGKSRIASLLTAFFIGISELLDLLPYYGFYGYKIYWGNLLLAVFATVFYLVTSRKAISLLYLTISVTAAFFVRALTADSVPLYVGLPLFACTVILSAVALERSSRSAAALAFCASYLPLTIFPFIFSTPFVVTLFGKGEGISLMTSCALAAWIVSKAIGEKAYASKIYGRDQWQYEAANELKNDGKGEDDIRP